MVTCFIFPQLLCSGTIYVTSMIAPNTSTVRMDVVEGTMKTTDDVAPKQRFWFGLSSEVLLADCCSLVASSLSGVVS